MPLIVIEGFVGVCVTSEEFECFYGMGLASGLIQNVHNQK